MLRAVNWGGGGGGGGGCDLFSSQLVHRGASGSWLDCFSARTGLSGRLVVLGGYHNYLGSDSDVILQNREFISPTIQFFHNYWWVQRQGLEKRGSRPKAPSEILQKCIHTVHINLLNGLPESAREVMDGLVFSFEDGLERADVPFLSGKA